MIPRSILKKRGTLKPSEVSDNDWKYSHGWFLEASNKELRDLLLTTKFGRANFKDAEAELDRRASVRRQKIDRIVLWLGFVAALVAAVASVISVTKGP
jgi:hypothetical protein